MLKKWGILCFIVGSRKTIHVEFIITSSKLNDIWHIQKGFDTIWDYHMGAYFILVLAQYFHLDILIN
jgi:hypothetical protein